MWKIARPSEPEANIIIFKDFPFNPLRPRL